jgi:hypothetical protein
LGFGSFREDDVACVERPLTDTRPPRKTEEKAATRGRDRLSREDAGDLARGADEAKDRVNRNERDFAGRQRMDREMVCVAMDFRTVCEIFISYGSSFRCIMKIIYVKNVMSL